MSTRQPKVNQWSTGLFDCEEDKTDCCLSILCFPCYACKAAKRYGECLCLPLIDQFGLMRVSMRHRYSIEGSIPKDFVLTLCCCPCVWCQMSREIAIREPEPVTNQAR